jgi:hypothetical protein
MAVALQHALRRGGAAAAAVGRGRRRRAGTAAACPAAGVVPIVGGGAGGGALGGCCPRAVAGPADAARAGRPRRGRQVGSARILVAHSQSTKTHTRRPRTHVGAWGAGDSLHVRGAAIAERPSSGSAAERQHDALRAKLQRTVQQLRRAEDALRRQQSQSSAAAAGGGSPSAADTRALRRQIEGAVAERAELELQVRDVGLMGGCALSRSPRPPSNVHLRAQLQQLSARSADEAVRSCRSARSGPIWSPPVTAGDIPGTVVACAHDVVHGRRACAGRSAHRRPRKRGPRHGACRRRGVGLMGGCALV